MRPRELFYYYLTDYSNSNNFYVDNAGRIQTTNVPTRLKDAPMGWLESQLKFSRNEHYHGINRSYTQPLKFVGDGAAIIRNVFYTGKGIEQLIQLVILKWDPVQDAYFLYYKGLLDLSNMEDNVQEGVTVNIMEGGAIQLLKAYENTVFEIPCDGSIPQNIKANVDGILFNDVFHYSFIPMTAFYPGIAVAGAIFNTNDGDNIGIIRNNPSYEQPTGAPNTYFASSGNYIFSSVSPTSVTITGSIAIKANPLLGTPTKFYMYAVTSLSQPRGVDGVDHAVGLVGPQTPSATGFYNPSTSQVDVNGYMVFNFNQTINLAAGENLFIVFFNESSEYPIKIVGGNFDLSFSSKAPPSRPWGLTLWDLFQLIMQNINALASTTIQSFNFGAQSQLLQDNLNIFITCGDALRASTDPNYYQYFNAATINPANPNNQFFNQYQCLGPSIKASLRDVFDFANARLNASLGNQILGTSPEALFIEDKAYVFDSSEVTMELGEVAEFTIEAAKEYYWNWLKLGYQNPQLDEKAGKFEYNTTAQYQAPIKTLAEVLDLTTKWYTSSYLVEYTRYNTVGGKSTTFNGNDNSVFALDINYDSWEMDFYSALFASTLTTTTNPNNTNIRLYPSINLQQLFMPTLDGEFFVNDNSPCIFIFNQPISGVNYNFAVNFQALINGLSTDSATIKMWINGAVVQTWTQAVTGTNTVFNGSASFTRACSLGDNVWFTIDTTISCAVQLSQFTINVGAGYWVAELAGVLNVNQGSAEQLIPLPTVTPTLISEPGHPGNVFPCITYGFQYFRYVNEIANNDFVIDFSASALMQGDPSQNTTFYLYYNGQILNQFSLPGTAAITSLSGQISQQLTFKDNDIVFVLASSQTLYANVTNVALSFTSTTIKAYDLNRPAFTNVSGIPNPTSAYNMLFSTKNTLLKHGNWLRSTLDQIGGQLTFQTLDKNQYLSYTLDGETYTDNANINVRDLDDPLFLPFIFKFKTQVPINFSNLLAYTANGHIQFSYLGKQYYGFPLEVTQKPSLNDTQEWKLLASPLNTAASLVNLNYDGLPPTLQLMAGEIFIPYTCPLKFVPLNQTQNPQYNFIHMDDDWFINQVNFWVHKENYFAKRQLNDKIPILIISNGVTSASLQIYSQVGTGPATLVTTVAMSVVTPAPLQTPYITLIGTIDITALSLQAGVSYYVVLQAGGNTPCISEGFVCATKWAMPTLLAEYTSSVNKLSVPFNNNGATLYTGNFRFEGWLDKYEPGAKFTTYEDQPADITLLNAIRMRTFKLNVAAPKGVPDWVPDLVNDITLLDTWFLDGKQFTRDTGAQWEVTETEMWPKRYWTLKIREAINKTGVTFSASGAIEATPIVTATIDQNAFGQNPGSGPDLIQVTES